MTPFLPPRASSDDGSSVATPTTASLFSVSSRTATPTSTISTASASSSMSTEPRMSTEASISTKSSTPEPAQSRDSRWLLDAPSTSPVPPLAPSTTPEDPPSTPAPRNPHVYRRSPVPRRKDVLAVLRKQSTNFKELCVRKTASLKAMCTERSPGLGRKASDMWDVKTPEPVDVGRGRQRSRTTIWSPPPAVPSPRESPSPVFFSNATKDEPPRLASNSNATRSTSSTSTFKPVTIDHGPTSITATSEASRLVMIDRDTTIRRPSPPVWRPSLPPLDLVAEFDVAD